MYASPHSTNLYQHIKIQYIIDRRDHKIFNVIQETIIKNYLLFLHCTNNVN